MTKRQYVAVKFRPNDRRSYTYHYDGPETLKVGDVVKVPGKLPADGWTALPVVHVQDFAPAFDTKAILGLAPPKEPPAQADLLDEDAKSPPRGNWPGGASSGSDPADQ